MRRLLVLIVVALVAVLAINRQRVFLRDPLGKVTKNGVESGGARVYVNYSNDVLIEDSGAQRMVIVQNWNKVPGTPRETLCLRGIVCWTEADHPQMVPLGGASYSPDTVMSDREVSFNDGYGVGVRVTLR